MADTVGARLRRLRTERGWTLYEAAKRAGMTQWSLFRLEQKTTLGNAQVTSLKRLARLYQVSIDYLAREAGDEEMTAAGMGDTAKSNAPRRRVPLSGQHKEQAHCSTDAPHATNERT